MIHPQNLEEAVDILHEELGEDQRIIFKAISHNDFLVKSSHFIGGAIRNEWELWYNDRPLCKWFTNLGITHGDDRGEVIIAALHARLKGIEYDLKGHVTQIKEYWIDKGYKDGIHPMYEKPLNGG